jgi:hypothetical protein
MKLVYKNILNKSLFALLGAGVTFAIVLILFSGLWKYRALDTALKAASKPDYNSSTYNCVDFSKDAVSKLKTNNIESNIVVIKQDPNSPKTHTVIGVWIDPQNGQFVSGAEYMGEYNELKNQFGWAR